jgi:hypothetical protein
MNTFHVGQLVRCTPRHLDGCTHTIRQIDDDGALWVEGLAVRLNPAHVEPIAPPYSIPAAAHEAPDDGLGSLAYDVATGDQWTADQLRQFFNLPPDNCIPESARRILDMGRTQQSDQPQGRQSGVSPSLSGQGQPSPAVQPADPRAEGIARAVDRLSQRDDAFMPAASRFHP